jgi:hypothetical protein
MRGTRRDLAACFVWKKVGVGFSSLISRLVEARCGWCTWHYREGHVRMKSMMDRSMRWAASDPAILTLLFFMY